MSFVEDILEHSRSNKKKARDWFGNLNAVQLNWKPDGQTWSVGECLEHIMVSDSHYFERFQRAHDKSYRRKGIQRLGFMNKAMGKAILKSVEPTARKKMKTFEVFEPKRSTLPTNILDEFEDHLDKINKEIGGLEGKDLSKIIVSSPANKMINYSLEHACQILVNHAERHLNQAHRVSEHPQFPA